MHKNLPVAMTPNVAASVFLADVGEFVGVTPDKVDRLSGRARRAYLEDISEDYMQALSDHPPEGDLEQRATDLVTLRALHNYGDIGTALRNKDIDVADGGVPAILEDVAGRVRQALSTGTYALKAVGDTKAAASFAKYLQHGDRSELELLACSGEDTELFFQKEKEDVAKKICRGCPLRQPCLAYALQNQMWGIWGGTHKTRRERLLRAAKILAASAPTVGDSTVVDYNESHE